MQPVQYVEKPIQAIFTPIVGKIRIKTYFSYYGIFANNFMIALYKDDYLFLRTIESTQQEIKAIEGTFVLEDPQVGLQTKNFYAIPLSRIPSLQNFASWVNATLAEMTEQQEKRLEKQKTQIRSLPNMNVKLERILKRLNINNIEEFKQRGYLNVFVDLIKQGADGSDLLLYRLHGAIHHKSIYHLTPLEKIMLLKEANQAMYDAGLRHKFNIPE